MLMSFTQEDANSIAIVLLSIAVLIHLWRYSK